MINKINTRDMSRLKFLTEETNGIMNLNYSNTQVNTIYTSINYVIVVGLGGIGWYVAKQLHMLGINLILYDDDKLDNSNLSRIDADEKEIGQYKVAAFMRWATNNNSSHKHQFHISKFIGIYNVIRGQGIKVLAVFDCTDDLEAQIAIYKECKNLDEVYVPYIKLGYDGFHYTVTTTDPSKVWGSTNRTYSVGSCPMTSMYVASIGVALLFSKKIFDHKLNISKNII